MSNTKSKRSNKHIIINMKNNYIVNTSFFYTLENEVIEIPTGTVVFCSSICTETYCFTHANIPSFTVDSSFIKKNKKFFSEISESELDTRLIVNEVASIIKESKDMRRVIEELGRTLNFIPFTINDIDEMLDCFPDESDMEIGKSPVTPYTWSSTALHKKIDYTND
jgi:hypothetical protein